MSGRLSGKTALVTAAGQGIGRAATELFVREGARVIATDVDAAKLAGMACETMALDVTDAAAIAAMPDRTGPIDALLNCAGFVHHGTILDCDEAARAAFVARQPMGRLGEPNEIAALALYLASDDSAFTTGATHVIDGGWIN